MSSGATIPGLACILGIAIGVAFIVLTSGDLTILDISSAVYWLVVPARVLVFPVHLITGGGPNIYSGGLIWLIPAVNGATYTAIAIFARQVYHNVRPGRGEANDVRDR